MDGRHDGFCELRWERLSPVLGYAELFPEQGLRGRGAERDDDSRLDQPDFLLKPGATRPDLPCAGFLVQPAAPLDNDKLEMLDRIGHVHLTAVYSCLLQPCVEQPSSRTDERMTLSVLLITGLLAYQHDLCFPRTFTKDSLRRVHPEITPSAGSRRLTQRRQRGPGRNKVRGSSGRKRGARTLEAHEG